MTKITSNIEELKKILNEPNFKLDEATEFLEAIESNVEDMHEEIGELKSEVCDKESEIAEFENVDDFDVTCDTTIECGIGQINYETPNNLLLQDLMDNLGIAIQKLTPKKVNEILLSII